MRFARTLLSLASVALCQRLDAQSLFIGFRAGQATAVQYWRFPDFDERGKTDRRPASVTSGLSATLDLKSWLAIESELMYVEKGWQQGRDDLSLGYLELPVLLRLSAPSPVPGVLVFLHGGPAPSTEVSCSGSRRPPILDRGVRSLETGLQSLIVVPRGCEERPQTKRDFGWVTGGGLLVRQPGYQISVSMRRTRGVRDLFPDDAFQERFNDTRALLVSVTAKAK